MPILRAEGFDLDYSQAGSGPTIILLHSSASGNRQWQRLIAELQDRYRLIAVNLFGYGGTTPWPNDRKQTLADQAELVRAAASLAAEPVILIGHSLGAAIACEAGMQFGSRARALILFEPILFYLLKDRGPATAFAEIDGVAQEFRRRADANDWVGSAAMFIDYWSGSGTWEALSPRRQAEFPQLARNVRHEWDAVITGQRRLEEWGKIAAPVHLIRAADTRPPTREVAGLLAATHHWPLQEVAAGGHMAPLARPDLVNPLIVNLLEDKTR
jgi:pimeloyl-ACP methyl ester carboxylesterase